MFGIYEYTANKKIVQKKKKKLKRVPTTKYANLLQARNLMNVKMPQYEQKNSSKNEVKKK